MSIAYREQLCSKLLFADESAKADLLDPERTTTELVLLLGELSAKIPERLYITAVRTDHICDGGAHGHNPGGDSADLWVDPSLPDAAIADVLRALAGFAQEGTLVEQVGLGGAAKGYCPTGFPAGFDLFDDNDEDHVHVSAKLPVDG